MAGSNDARSLARYHKLDLLSGPPELVTLGRTLSRRAADVLAYFDPPAPATAQPRR